MNHIFLLGAGASKEAGIPDSFGMSAEIARIANQNAIDDQFYRRNPKEMARAVNFVIGGLLNRSGQRNLNPLEIGVDVEDFFNSVLFLAERESSDIAPFVGSWNSAIEDVEFASRFQPNWESIVDELIREASNKGSEKAIEYITNRSSRTYNSRSSTIALHLKSAFDSLSRRRSDGAVFQRTAERMKKLLQSLVWIDDQNRVEYLRPLVDLSKNGEPTTIATLNYDNTIEIAAESLGQRVQLGVNKLDSNRNLTFGKDGIHLLKLHGSIDWTLKRVRNRETRIETVEVDIDDVFKPMGERISSHDDYYNPAVIFGSRNKLTAEGPFLDLLQMFRRRLTKSKSLVVIGYSFRDPHINTYIARWLNSKQSNKLTVIDPGFNSSKQEFCRTLKTLSTSGPNARLSVIEEPASTGIATFANQI